MSVVSKDQYKAQLKQVWQLINQRQFAQAQPHARRLSEHYPEQVQSWFVASYLAMQQGQYVSALEAIDKAILIEPNERRWRMHKVRCLLMAGNKQTAIKVFNGIDLGAQPHRSLDYACHGELAMLANRLGLYAKAKAHYQQALQLVDTDDQRSALYFNLASVERYLGELTEARKHLDDALALNPQDCEAQLLRSSLTTQNASQNHIDELHAMLAQSPISPLAATQLNYALAKEYEDLQDYRHSAEHLTCAAKTRRAHMQYDVSADVQTLATLRTLYKPEFFAPTGAACSSDTPIFILGLPRTGSTLVERILSQHPDIESAGELNHFAKVMTQMLRIANPGIPLSKVAMVQRSSALNFKELGERYVQSLTDERPNARFVIDKLPLNSLYTGLIHKALPQAKIIYIQRHPLASCYAMYKQLFTHGYPFSYDLDELGKYYIAHHTMMAQCQQALGSAMFTLQYEALVDDFEPSVAALANYCGVDLQPQMLAFASNTAASTTASAAQVRQGLYRSSRDQWRNFETLLAPLKQQLINAGIPCA